MAQPPIWFSTQNYTQYAINHPSAPFDPASLDLDFANLLATIQGIEDNLVLLQRDDGALANGIVTSDTLDQSVINMIGDWNPRGTWVTGRNYAKLDMVTPSPGSVSYVCATAHTSGATFAADFALGYWQPVNGAGTASVSAADVQFTATDRILGRQSSGAGAGEEITCTAAARSILDDASVADIATTLGLGTGSNPTFNNVTVAGLTVSGLTAKSFVYTGVGGLLSTTAAPTNGQLLIGSTGAVPVAATLTGTPNQVTVTNGAGTITLALPQDIHTGATPAFAGFGTTGPAGVGTGSIAGTQFFVVGSGLTGTTQIGVSSALIASSAATALSAGVFSSVQTAAAAFTTGIAASFYAAPAVAGAGSTITIDAGVYAPDRTAGTINAGFLTDVSSGASKYAFLGLGTATSQFGGVVSAQCARTTGEAINLRAVSTTVTVPVGATATAAALIPDGAFVFGVVTRVTTTLGNATGTTGYQVGDGTTATRFGVAGARTAGTTTDSSSATVATFASGFSAATNVVLTAVGGNFDGTGVVRITVFYADLTPPTS